MSDVYNDFSDNPLVNVVDDKIILTDDQKAKIIKFWNSRPDDPPTLAEVVFLVFEKNYDVRAKPGLAVRTFLADSSLAYKSQTTEKEIKRNAKAHITELTEGQKQYIIANAKDLKPMKLACLLFDNIKLTPLDKEFKLVNEFYKTLDPKIFDGGPDAGGDYDNYNPPKHLMQAAARVNKYVYENAIKPEQWKTNSQIKLQLESLIKFCHHDRFVLLANKLDGKQSRDLFEGSFIRYVWDKTDLTAEEVDLYIDICNDIIMDSQIADEIIIANRKLEDASESADNKKLSVSILEHIKNLRDEAADNKERRAKAIQSLQGKRSERIENKNKENDSLSALVDFVKLKDKRDRMIKHVELRQKQLIEETERVSDMSEFVMEIYGISPEEIIYGKI